MMEGAKAVIIVSHSMRFVEQICTRAIWIDQGRLRADGDAEKVVDEYRTAMGMKKPRKRLNRRKRRRNVGKKKTTTAMERKATSSKTKKKDKQNAKEENKNTKKKDIIRTKDI